MSDQRFSQEGQDRALLQAERLHRRQNALPRTGNLPGCCNQTHSSATARPDAAAVPPGYWSALRRPLPRSGRTSRVANASGEAAASSDRPLHDGSLGSPAGCGSPARMCHLRSPRMIRGLRRVPTSSRLASFAGGCPLRKRTRRLTLQAGAPRDIHKERKRVRRGCGRLYCGSGPRVEMAGRCHGTSCPPVNVASGGCVDILGGAPRACPRLRKCL
jgi:hypothetical protein